MKIGIIGGGASGMAAAIAASGPGMEVTILEKNERVGKKLLATGNGKCNLSNLQLSYACYRSDTPEYLPPILQQFTVEDTLCFFHRLGLMTRDKGGYLYPECEQASAVLDVLRFALVRLRVKVKTGVFVTKIVPRSGGQFTVYAAEEAKQCVHTFDRVILASGSRAGLKRGEEENGMQLAALLGLKKVPFTQALAGLRCREKFFQALAGVRCQAQVSLRIKGQLYQEQGELQLTQYGISGIPVFQLSRYAAKELAARKGQLQASIDFLPEITEEQWKAMLLARRKQLGCENAEQFFTGTVHKKIAAVILKESGILLSEQIERLPEEKLLAAGRLFKAFPVTVTGVNPFEQAQVCAGGIQLSELTDQLEAKQHKGLFITGELLDADGRCGGYNLQWAWSTGVIAGCAASGQTWKSRKERKG